MSCKMFERIKPDKKTVKKASSSKCLTEDCKHSLVCIVLLDFLSHRDSVTYHSFLRMDIYNYFS